MTAQLPEKLIFNGEETYIYFYPPLPEDYADLIRLEDSDMTSEEPLVLTTACGRRYMGIWEIKNGKFYLVDIAGCYKMREKHPILAKWFSGVIRVPQGKLLRQDRANQRTYEQEIHVSIDHGEVIESTLVNHQQEVTQPNPDESK